MNGFQLRMTMLQSLPGPLFWTHGRALNWGTSCQINLLQLPQQNRLKLTYEDRRAAVFAAASIPDRFV